MSRSRRRRRRRKGEIRIPKRLMPFIAVGAVLLLAGTVALAISTGKNSAGGSPDLVIEQEVFDYGEVAFNTPIQTVFVLRNEGDAPLKIIGIPQVELKDGC